MTATHEANSTPAAAPVLFVSLELGWFTWKLACTIGPGQKPRLRSVKARSIEVLLAEIQAAKKRFGMPDDAQVVCYYEAGRNSFWLHRFLLAHGVLNIVVDSASIEVNRRKHPSKSGRLDAIKLVAMLIRFCNGGGKVWAVVNPPTAGGRGLPSVTLGPDRLKDGAHRSVGYVLTSNSNPAAPLRG